MKALFSLGSTAGAAYFGHLARRRPWRSTERWAGMAIVAVFLTLAAAEAVRAWRLAAAVVGGGAS